MKLIPIILVVLLSLVGSLQAAQDPAEAVRQFKESLKTVDRVVLMRTEWDKPKDGEQGKIVFEIKGTELIATLGETLEIKKFDMPCLCRESPEIHFYQGESYRFSLTLHHSTRLRGEDAALGGDTELTEQSAERFRVWFAQRGYDGFVKRYEKMLKAMAQEKARQDRFLEIFPEPVRIFFPTEDEEDDRNAKQQKSARILAFYQNRTDLILDCWRGLGEHPASYSSGSWESRYQDFLRGILNSLGVSDLHAAFAALPANEDRVWIGACRYSRYPGARREEGMAEVFTVEWFAHLAKRVLPLVKPDEQEWILEKLAERSSVATNRLLLEIAGSDPLALTRAKDGEERFSGPRMSNGLQAILALAKNRVVDCRTIVLRRLPEITDPEVRLALEVAMAQFDGSAAVGTAHLQCEIGDVAELAWQTVTKDSSLKISIDTLAALAAQSKSYRVRQGAAQALEKFGVRVMTDSEKAEAVLHETRFRQALGVVEIETLLANYDQTIGQRKADPIERRVLAALNHRKGLLLLQAGNYEQAVPFLERGFADRESSADAAFALQTMGHFSDAFSRVGGMIDQDEIKAFARYLIRHGYLAFAAGEFESAAEKFAAVETIGYSSMDDGPLTLIHYLSQLMTGKNADIPAAEWESFALIGEPLSEDEVFWPYTGNMFLRGKLSEAEVLARIEKQKGAKEKNLCEAHLFFSVLCRAKGDAAGEIKHLQAALDTKTYTTQCFSLATVRFRELSAAKK